MDLKFRRACLMTLTVLLAACGDKQPQDTTAAATGPSKVLSVYNWADYVAPATIADFEARTGIKVTYDVFDSADMLATKLLTGGSGYDVVVPNGGTTYRLGQNGAFQKLDKSRLKNLGNLDPHIMQIVAANDPGNQYAIPYLWGTTGIGYNPDLVEKALGTRTIDSLAAVFDPALASQLRKCGITMLDSAVDMYQVALVYLGRDPNSQRPEDIAAAERALTAVRPYIRYYHSSRYVSDLATGEVCISIGWSGAIQQARAAGAQLESPVHVEYVIPKEGAPVWFDMVAIPADAPNVDAAYAFLDYLLEPKVIADITNTVGQANGNAASLPFVKQDLRDNPSVYPSPEVFKRLTIDKAWEPALLSDIGRRWIRMQVGE
ncbi:MAG: polyamine ABC transporter substrate-binding protein [Gammaproteobacteria bacterium]|nr:polyamine ABC transporter substrate-binding protein [Gammaproteobacteria bacterium]